MTTMLTPLADEFTTLRQAMDRLIDQAFVGSPLRTIWSRTWAGMPVDVYATEDHAVILATVPGLKPEDLDVAVHQNTVVLSGKVADYAAQLQGAAWYIREIPFGEFRRSVTLPFAVDADKAEATFEHGIVRIVLPKAEAAKPRKIAIKGGVSQALGAGQGAGQAV